MRTRTVNQEQQHIVYRNLSGDLYWDKNCRKKIFCPVHTRTQLSLDLETQSCEDEFTLIRKHTRCSKYDSEER
jgi:hypothetical protein